MDNPLLTKCLVMKNYPFIRVLIQMYWLLLFIAIGLMSVAFKNTFFSEETNASLEIPKATDIPESAVSPELLKIITSGKKLFRTNCASCHNKSMKSDMIGPALAGVRNRWEDYPKGDLYAWIRNSAKLIDEKHPKALEVFKAWEEVTMTSFNTLTDKDIEAILVYIDSVE